MQNFSYENEFYLHENRVADSDLQIRGGAVIQTLRYGGGGGRSKKKNFAPPPPKKKNFPPPPPKKKKFRPFGPPFGLKIRGGLGPPDPSPGSATGIKDHFQINDLPSRLALEQRPGAIRKWPIN